MPYSSTHVSKMTTADNSFLMLFSATGKSWSWLDLIVETWVTWLCLTFKEAKRVRSWPHTWGRGNYNALSYLQWFSKVPGLTWTFICPLYLRNTLGTTGLENTWRYFKLFLSISLKDYPLMLLSLSPYVSVPLPVRIKMSRWRCKLTCFWMDMSC